MAWSTCFKLFGADHAVERRVGRAFWLAFHDRRRPLRSPPIKRQVNGRFEDVGFAVGRSRETAGAMQLDKQFLKEILRRAGAASNG